MVFTSLGNIEAGPLVIESSDFRSLDVAVSLQRYTSPQSSDYRFELLEIDNQFLTLDAPRTFCLPGHRVFLGLSMHGESHFTATSKVLTVEPISDGRARVQISLIQYDDKSWRKILTKILSVQENIELQLKNIKGY
jgi:hypothetical protein